MHVINMGIETMAKERDREIELSTVEWQCMQGRRGSRRCCCFNYLWLVKRFLCGGAAGRNGHDTWIIADNKMVEEAGGPEKMHRSSKLLTCAQIIIE